VTGNELGQPLPEKIVIVRALPGLGDMLCAVPAFRALRAALPEARITLLGLSWARAFVERFNRYLDEFIEFPGYPGLPEVQPPIQQLPVFFSWMQQRKFDLALQMHGNGSNINAFTVLLGAKLNAGFFLPGQYCPDETRFLPYPGHEQEIWRHLRLMEFLDIPLQGETMEFPITETDKRDLAALAEIKSLRPGEYVCVHPGAQGLNRRWPVERFTAVADALAAQGFQVVLTGTAQESILTQAVRQAMTAPALDLAGRTSLGAMAALVSNARLVVCNDTGVSHLSAALRIPSVVIFSNSDPHRWAPLDRKLHRIISPAADRQLLEPCPTALMDRCLRDDCLVGRSKPDELVSEVSPDVVIALVDDLMQEITYDGTRQLA
jgi:ADP-heptose:LPS heptosyltransferase